MVNLANDSIGYIIPKSEWDENAPWIYEENEETLDAYESEKKEIEVENDGLLDSVTDIFK